MLDSELILALFNDDLPEPAYWESKSPPRNLPPGAIVTRFSPSPTGFIHTGGVYVATIAKNLARHSGGVYFIRIEDTDQAREIAGWREQFERAFEYFSIKSDEEDATSQWGPYEQSKRALIYHTYARDLLLRGQAYLCFCTRDELAELAEKQLAAKVNSGYYGMWARCRHLSIEEVRSRLKAGQPYTIRFRSPDGEPARIVYDDLIRGPIEQPENRNDIILLKSSDQIPRLPTYHFAHAVDDHLMRVTLVIRGDEWISSVPLHLQLFKALGFEPIPYAHIAPLMKMEGASRRKLSKRKDPEANVEFYISSGYPAGAVLHYLRGLANSRLAEMGFEGSAQAAIVLSECGVAGPIFDLIKLESISREYISQMSLEETQKALITWAESYDCQLAEIIRADPAYTQRILATERESGATQRKDVSKWSDFRSVYGLFFPGLFTLVTDPADSRFSPVDATTVRSIARGFANSYQHFSDKEAWFEQIRVLAASHGFAPSAAEFKKARENFVGSISDVSNVIRVALTGQTRSPELFLVAQAIGREEVLRRVNALSDSGPISAESSAEIEGRSNFIRDIIIQDMKEGKHGGRVQTRFPPEPNGYLHIGHAKAICLDFGLAAEFGGKCNLRFDDTNPSKEETEYVDSIMEDVQWLGFQWDGLFYASDYFGQLYQWAIQLIKAGKAYVCDLSADEVRQYRGTLTEPGKESPYRNRSMEENLDLFERMKNGDFADGSRTLRAKIDMASPNLNMRDPVMYRILHMEHHRTSNQWCIYPMYDYAHGQSDSIEQVTHSICTLEFEDHRPLYNWFIEQLGIFPSQQYEFDRLSITYTLLSKRKLLTLVQEDHVDGWDDPRMPTLSGMRRRGYTPEAIRNFCANIGVSKTNGVTQLSHLEYFVREDLNKHAARVMAVLRPLRVVIDNYPDDLVEEMEAVNNPEDKSAGTRKVPFSKVLYIEQEDFREDPPKQYYRLAPGREVRLRYGYLITCRSVVKDGDGNVVELHCTYDPATRGGNTPDGRKVKSTLHWVSAAHAVDAEVRIYDKLFTKENPNEVEEGQDFTANLNPSSLVVLSGCKVEPSLQDAAPGTRYQFERLGYFCVDPASATGKPVFNRTIDLRDTWSKIERREKR